MSWLITPQEKTAIDRFGIQNVSLLLHGNGTNGSTTIVDSSPSAKTVTAVGNAQISTAQSKFGNASIVFDGSNDKLSIPYTSDFNLLNTYTIETWIYPLTISGTHVIFSLAASVTTSFGCIALYQNNTTLWFEIKTLSGSGVGFYYSISGGTITSNNWQHIAASVSNNSAKLFLNGTQVGLTVTITDWGFAPVGVGIGGTANDYNISTQAFNGYLDDLRITKGIARYNANFTPPTAPFPDF
jgi:Concanavalin A-like lectin/glucanases superfamily